MPTPGPLRRRPGGRSSSAAPKGFGEQELTEEDLRNQERAEHARALLVGAVDAFRAKVREVNAEAISRAVYFCLKTLGD